MNGRQIALAGVLTHAELVHRAYRWLLGAGKCVVAVTERGAQDAQIGTEIADAIGWHWDGRSTVIEVKTTHADFMADGAKPHRNGDSGLGDRRYFMCPRGVIERAELPEGWGLLYATAYRVNIEVNATARPDSARRERLEKRMCIDLLRRVYVRGFEDVIRLPWNDWLFDQRDVRRRLQRRLDEQRVMLQEAAHEEVTVTASAALGEGTR